MDYDPVVIPPLEVVHASLKFSYDGWELRVFGNAFDEDVASYLPYLTPVLTPTSRVAKKQRGRRPTIPKRGINYWRAQCVFRGLPHTGKAVEPLQNAIRAAPEKKMLPEFAEMEKRLRKEFIPKNAAARDEKSKKETGMTWAQAQREEERKVLQAYNEERQNQAAAYEARWKTLDAEQQAANNAVRFLKEAFPPGGPKKAAIVLKTLDENSRDNIHHNAEPLGLHSETTDAPRIVGTSATRAWIVIGREKANVKAQMQEIEREALQARKRWEEAQDAGDWDVTGSWWIRCPEIEKQWEGEEEKEELWLDVYKGRVNGKMQMWAQFDFRMLTGVWRFETSSAGTGVAGGSEGKGKGKGKGKGEGEKKTAAREWDGWEMEVEDEEEDEKEEENEDFYLRKNDKVSEKQPKLNFRWRGRESGEGVIELYSDRKLCEVTFSGRGGWKMSGVFRSTFTSNCTFTGVKVDTKQREGGCDIQEQWQDHSEYAYERERVGRWG